MPTLCRKSRSGRAQPHLKTNGNRQHHTVTTHFRGEFRVHGLAHAVAHRTLPPERTLRPARRAQSAQKQDPAPRWPTFRSRDVHRHRGRLPLFGGECREFAVAGVSIVDYDTHGRAVPHLPHGVLDDLLDLSARVKFAVQLAASAFMPLCGLYVNNLYGLFGL